MKHLRGIVESPTAPNTTDVLWLDADGGLKAFKNGEWKGASNNGGGVLIVDSVDKLDPNAKQGSLASVVISTPAKISFSELYQPTTDEVNMETFVVDTTNLSKVTGISISSYFDISTEFQAFMVYLFSKDFDMHGRVGQVIAPFMGEIGGAKIMNLSTQEQSELELFIPNDDGTITVNEENLAIINNLLSATEFVYGGTFSSNNGEQVNPSYVDIFYKTIGGIQKKTYLYIKDVGRWEQYSELVDGSITTEKVADGAIITTKIADRAIIFDKLCPDIQKVLDFTIQHFGLIIFKDKEVGTICVANWDTNGDGSLTKEEAEAVTNINTAFRKNTRIVSFDELSNFTNLISIPDQAFYDCQSLASITIPERVTSIGKSAFTQCAFTDINIPERVTSIGNDAFFYCTSLTTITIPENSQLTSIGQQAFAGCTSLTAITIPEGVTNIGVRAFSSDYLLTTVRNYATTPPTLGSDAFAHTPNTMVIYVPDASVSAYKAAPNWKNYASRIKPISEYTGS